MKQQRAGANRAVGMPDRLRVVWAVLLLYQLLTGIRPVSTEVSPSSTAIPRVYTQPDSTPHCLSAPCANGGTCTVSATSGGYSCACPEGYADDRCERRLTVITPCLSGPCLNGGACSDAGSTFVCACAPGYTGISCGQRDPCYNACENGGACTVDEESENGYHCSCIFGTLGPRCETVDPFESCPQSVDVALPDGETRAYVTWAEPRVRPAFDPKLVSSTPARGPFPIGHHRVVYGYNSSGPVTVCAFYVSVSGSSEPFVRSCPQDFQVALPSGQVKAYATWPAPTVIGLRSDHVVRAFDQHSAVQPGTLLRGGHHEFTYRIWQNYSHQAQWEPLCSFSINVIVGASGIGGGNNFNCSSTEILIFGGVLITAVVAVSGLGLMYFRTKRKLSRAASRSMVPLDDIKSIPKINNVSGKADERSRYQTDERSKYQTNSLQLPPVPPPKPGLVLEDNAYEALDNYGYMCLDNDIRKPNACRLPRAVYEVPKGPNQP